MARITGRNRNDIKEYISQTFHDALASDIEYEWLLQMLPEEKHVRVERVPGGLPGEAPVWSVRREFFLGFTSLAAAKSRAAEIMREAQRG